ncbi:hypothetical protein J32TS6_11830 [Virgibacillus pantothenticus]|nr:hypothetical protein J32TS6_11830 [Virgibacillus pantothenticus]SIS77330.1 fructokinase [Virgibacillus pantothenticus]
MKQVKLYTMIRKQFMKLLNDYTEVEHVDELIVAPELEDEQGVKGAIALTVKQEL